MWYEVRVCSQTERGQVCVADEVEPVSQPGQPTYQDLHCREAELYFVVVDVFRGNISKKI